jgi:hypothetical protein
MGEDKAMGPGQKSDMANSIIGKEGNKHAKKHSGKLDRMSITGAHGGGYVIEHHPASKPGPDSPGFQSPQSHIAGNDDALLQHIQQNAPRLAPDADPEESAGGMMGGQ